MMSRRNARDLVTDRVIDLETGLETDPETDPSRGESRRKEELSVDAAESPGSVSDDVSPTRSNDFKPEDTNNCSRL